jgi:hypothetical protein
MPKRNDLEQKALHYVVGTGYQGVLQSDLWRELGAAAAKAHASQLNWKRRGLFVEKKNFKKADGPTGSTQKGCQPP